MEINPGQLSSQEKDLQLFLDSLGVIFPTEGGEDCDEYMVIELDPAVGVLFEANDNKAVLLAYRMQGKVFPLFLAFLKGDDRVEFCYTALLLDSYTQGVETALILRVAAAEFFPQEIEELIEKLGLIWTGAPINGDLDCPIFWDTKPEISIITDLLVQKLGTVDEIPLFPSVFYYNNIYDQNLLEAVLPQLSGCEDILIMGCGAGLEAVCVALQYGVHVDATDINPIAIANTMAACRRTGTEALVSGWVSDGFLDVEKSYDAILFEAPLTTREIHLTDRNRYDVEGRLLREVLGMLPYHLKTGGRMYLMSRPDLTPYLPGKGLKWKVLRYFAENMSLAILEIWQG